jgi:hypothetical protein
MQAEQGMLPCLAHGESGSIGGAHARSVARCEAPLARARGAGVLAGAFAAAGAGALTPAVPQQDWPAQAALGDLLPERSSATTRTPT